MPSGSGNQPNPYPNKVIDVEKMHGLTQVMVDVAQAWGRSNAVEFDRLAAALEPFGSRPDGDVLVQVQMAYVEGRAAAGAEDPSGVRRRMADDGASIAELAAHAMGTVSFGSRFMGSEYKTRDTVVDIAGVRTAVYIDETGTVCVDIDGYNSAEAWLVPDEDEGVLPVLVRIHCDPIYPGLDPYGCNECGAPSGKPCRRNDCNGHRG